MSKYIATALCVLTLSACGIPEGSNLYQVPSSNHADSYFSQLSQNQVQHLIYSGLASVEKDAMEETGKKCVLFLAESTPNSSGMPSLSKAANTIIGSAEAHYGQSSTPYALSSDEMIVLSTERPLEIYLAVFDEGRTHVYSIGEFVLSKSFIDENREQSGSVLASHLISEVMLRLKRPVPAALPPF